jgi:hypothetical protein
MDRKLLHGMLLGAMALVVVGALVAAEGSQPHHVADRHDCACPDSDRIESPRALFPH